MERFPAELIYLIVFAGFVLFNWLTQLAARRRQQQEQARAEEAGQIEPPAEDEPLENTWGRAPEPVPESAPEPALEPAPASARAPVLAPRPAPLAAPQVARRLHPVRALLKDKRDLRRAVILTMVLGPCRAQEPPEQR